MYTHARLESFCVAFRCSLDQRLIVSDASIGVSIKCAVQEREKSPKTAVRQVVRMTVDFHDVGFKKFFP